MDTSLWTSVSSKNLLQIFSSSRACTRVYGFRNRLFQRRFNNSRLDVFCPARCPQRQRHCGRPWFASPCRDISQCEVIRIIPAEQNSRMRPHVMPKRRQELHIRQDATALPFSLAWRYRLRFGLLITLLPCDTLFRRGGEWGQTRLEHSNGCRGAGFFVLLRGHPIEMLIFGKRSLL